MQLGSFNNFTFLKFELRALNIIILPFKLFFMFKIDFITSFACIEPATPAKVVNIPSDSPDYPGFSGIKYLKHGFF